MLYAAITLIIDILKGVVALIIDRLMQGLGVEPWAEYIAGVCVVLGHNFPVFFGFKGGIGVATSLGVVMMLDWKIGLAVLIIALAVMATTRYVSLGSIIAAVTFIVLLIAVMLISGNFNLVRFVCVMILGILLIVRHSANIVRLLNHTENKLGQKKKEEISK